MIIGNCFSGTVTNIVLLERLLFNKITRTNCFFKEMCTWDLQNYRVKLKTGLNLTT